MSQALTIPQNSLRFVTRDGRKEVDVRVDPDTVWLTLDQIADLFERDNSGISRHLRNIFRSGELEREATVAKFAIVQTEGNRKVSRDIEHYNLDAILSVGYRVNSSRGTEFRQWSNRVLRAHLKKRAEDAEKYLASLKNIELLAGTSTSQDPKQAADVLELIERYARSWHLLLQYDENRSPALNEPPSREPLKGMARLTHSQALKIIAQFRKSLAHRGEATNLFGQDRGEGLSSLLRNVEQTWGGQPVYPTVELRAAHIIYLTIKNHPFLDGNKRIGSLLFLHYLSKNSRHLLGENTLVALALLIAESDPSHKEFVIRLIIDLLEEAVATKAPA
jgi:prophage maintenance system killer protein